MSYDQTCVFDVLRDLDLDRWSILPSFELDLTFAWLDWWTQHEHDISFTVEYIMLNVSKV